ncbi:MAG TPA: antibiotic biosynthesis monooxygenase [Gaiellaceae bacterium]|nr:antibiotic biosynthesis monooxygenase [Gaiellaceae bacterium]
MIGRFWRGWAGGENAARYEALLRAEILPGIQRVEGYRGAYLLRRQLDGETEFGTLTLWDSLDAVRAFAGVDYELAVVPPEARALLSRFDERSVHYEIVAAPEDL